MAEHGVRSGGEQGRRRRGRRRARREDAAEPDAERAEEGRAEGGAAERVLSALGNQGVQRLLRGGVQGERAGAVQRQEDEEEEPDAGAASEEVVEEAGDETEPADIYELSPDVLATGPVIDALVTGALGDLEGGGPEAEQNASEKEWEALGAIDDVVGEVEGFGNDLLLAHMRALRQSLLLDTTILRPYVGEDAVGLDSAQKHLRNVSSKFADQFTDEAVREAGGTEETPTAEPGAS